MDLNGMLSYIGSDEKETETRELKRNLDQIDKVRAKNLSISVISKTSNTAQYQVNWDVEMTQDGRSDSVSMDAKWTLDRIDGRWLIVSTGE